jgi:hypothetical protein
VHRGSASRHPDPATARRLQFRALCFLTEPSDKSRLERLAGIWRNYPDDLAMGSILAKLDVITAGGTPVPLELTVVLDELCQSNDPDVAVSARLSRATGRRTLVLQLLFLGR